MTSLLLLSLGFFFPLFQVVMFSLSSVSRSFLISILIFSVTCWLFRNVLFNLHVFVFLAVFFLQSISSLIALWLKKMLDMISIFLNVLRFDLWCKVQSTAAKLLQSCPTLCNPIDGSTPGSPIPGILQARTLEWVGIAFSKCGLTWRIFHVHVRGRCILLHLDEMSWRYKWDPSHLMYHLRLVFPYEFSPLMICPLVWAGC